MVALVKEPMKELAETSARSRNRRGRAGGEADRRVLAEAGVLEASLEPLTIVASILISEDQELKGPTLCGPAASGPSRTEVL